MDPLSAALRSAGYDTWVDDEGSSLLPLTAAHAGPGSSASVHASEVYNSNLSEVLDDLDPSAAALGLASHVVVCVSRAYKESINCRHEAMCAKQLARRGRAGLLFVVLDRWVGLGVGLGVGVRVRVSQWQVRT